MPSSPPTWWQLHGTCGSLYLTLEPSHCHFHLGLTSWEKGEGNDLEDMAQCLALHVQQLPFWHFPCVQNKNVNKEQVITPERGWKWQELVQARGPGHYCKCCPFLLCSLSSGIRPVPPCSTMRLTQLVLPSPRQPWNKLGWSGTGAHSAQGVGLSASKQALLPSYALHNPEAAPVNKNAFFSFNETFLSFSLLPFPFQGALLSFLPPPAPPEASSRNDLSKGSKAIPY